MTRIALISDTHLPERLAGLPASIFDHLSGCDLVLHAGDVGTMEALDELARIAPVVAVRGNDGWTDSANVLPLEQIVVVGGTRILLWHGHFEDRSDELAWRHAAEWPDIFDRIAGRAKVRGADVVVTGHTHIPLAHEQDGVLLVNPGAIAPGNAFLAQSVRSVAILELTDHGELAHVDHIDIDRNQVVEVGFDPAEPFDAVAKRFQRTILAESIRPVKRDLDRFYRTDSGFRTAWLSTAHRVWAGAKEWITMDDLRTALSAGGPDARGYLERIASSAPATPRGSSVTSD